MRLTPTEEERLRVFAAADLARRTFAQGLKLNAPEAIAVVLPDAAVHLWRRGATVLLDVAAAGRAALGPDDVMDGVADIATEIRLEVLLEEGSRLVVLREPFGPPTADGPGAVRFGEGDVELVPERRRITLTVTNASERPVRVSSHYPFMETNAKLVFDRAAARGFRLDLPAGDSIRWDPGETKDVDLVGYGGEGGSDA